MKFYQTNFFMIASTAIITFALTATVFKLSYTAVYTFPISQRISLDDARNYAAQYSGDSRRLEVAVADDATGQVSQTTLKALRFDASQLDEIINHNRFINSAGVRDSTADEVVIYFGKNGTTSTGPLSNAANIHLIAVGSKNGSLMLNRTRSSDVNASSLFDKTKPCPGSPGCPTSF